MHLTKKLLSTQPISSYLIELSDGGEESINDLFTQHIDSLDYENEPLKLLLSLEKVSYLDSFSLGLIVCLHKKLFNSHGELLLVKPGGDIGKLMEITKLDRIFNIVDSIDEGIQKCHG